MIAPAELGEAREIAVVFLRDNMKWTLCEARSNLWLYASMAGTERCALRIAYSETAPSLVEHERRNDGTYAVTFVTSFGAVRARIAACDEAATHVRCDVSLLPDRDVRIDRWPTDLVPLGASPGVVHTAQRGLRTGIVFATVSSVAPYSLFYVQDFGSVSDYFAAVERSPADSVSGAWPDLGYRPPGGGDCTLRAGREIVISDAHLTLTERVPADEGSVAALYLDLLADTYLALGRQPTRYRDWPQRARRTLLDLSVSPECTYVYDGRRYVMPYVGDRTKPPESMVQLTLAVNTGEYDCWTGTPSPLARSLRANVGSFFDREVGSLVRWLPGADFGASQSEENMNHDAMDSWYLYHTLFNASRLGSEGDADAREYFAASLPFAMRVAHRFNYRWPVFFNLRDLDIVRAESAPGKGGEHDVAGLYALVMLHAHEMFGDDRYFAEAERAVRSLEGLGFKLGYQLNTTGFAAEAALRLWKKTQRPEYLAISNVCMANLFDNMWLWRCGYGHGDAYGTYFGLFPLRDAPYLAAFEELEAQGKFHDYLAIGGDDIRPSLRLLLAEYQKYNLHRGWSYYPDALPGDAVASKSRNGAIQRALSVPLEDLPDGHTQAGSVGQEVYGAGLAFVFTSRHYRRIADLGYLAYCDYPMYEYAVARDGKAAHVSWRAGGDPRRPGELRIVPDDAYAQPLVVTVRDGRGATIAGRVTSEGHAAFEIAGDGRVEIDLRPNDDTSNALAVGPLFHAAQ